MLADVGLRVGEEGKLPSLSRAKAVGEKRALEKEMKVRFAFSYLAVLPSLLRTPSSFEPRLLSSRFGLARRRSQELLSSKAFEAGRSAVRRRGRETRRSRKSRLRGRSGRSWAIRVAIAIKGCMRCLFFLPIVGGGERVGFGGSEIVSCEVGSNVTSNSSSRRKVQQKAEVLQVVTQRKRVRVAKGGKGGGGYTAHEGAAGDRKRRESSQTLNRKTGPVDPNRQKEI